MATEESNNNNTQSSSVMKEVDIELETTMKGRMEETDLMKV